MTDASKAPYSLAEFDGSYPSVEKARLRATVSAFAAAQQEVERLLRACELAWGVIANANGGDWKGESVEWQEAAARWRDEHWHPALDRDKPRRAALASSPPLAAPEAARSLSAGDVEKVREAIYELDNASGAEDVWSKTAREALAILDRAGKP